MGSRGFLRGTVDATGPIEGTAMAYRLTDRQREVLRLVAQGHPNKVIADFLEISEQTVKVHINQIFKELRVYNRIQAVLKEGTADETLACLCEVIDLQKHISDVGNDEAFQRHYAP